MKSWFEKRVYSQNMISRKIGRVKFRENKENGNKSAKGVPFVITPSYAQINLYLILISHVCISQKVKVVLM